MLPKFSSASKEELTILEEIAVAKKKDYVSFNVHAYGRHFL